MYTLKVYRRRIELKIKYYILRTCLGSLTFMSPYKHEDDPMQLDPKREL